MNGRNPSRAVSACAAPVSDGISGKDYYRCAGQKGRGTCGITLSVRKGALEHSAMAVLRHQLFMEDNAKIVTETFNREVLKMAGPGRLRSGNKELSCGN